MSNLNKAKEAKAILANKFLWATLDALIEKSVADWKGQQDPDKQYAIWHQVNAIARVRDSVRKVANDTVRNDRTDSET